MSGFDHFPTQEFRNMAKDLAEINGILREVLQLLRAASGEPSVE